MRKDLRFTVDNPEDLVMCRKIYSEFQSQAPKIKIKDIINYLDIESTQYEGDDREPWTSLLKKLK